MVQLDKCLRWQRGSSAVFLTAHDAGSVNISGDEFTERGRRMLEGFGGHIDGGSAFIGDGGSAG